LVFAELPLSELQAGSTKRRTPSTVPNFAIDFYITDVLSPFQEGFAGKPAHLIFGCHARTWTRKTVDV
jgi:hypothetical protein